MRSCHTQHPPIKTGLLSLGWFALPVRHSIVSQPHYWDTFPSTSPSALETGKCNWKHWREKMKETQPRRLLAPKDAASAEPRPNHSSTCPLALRLPLATSTCVADPIPPSACHSTSLGSPEPPPALGRSSSLIILSTGGQAGEL
ncbi:hypothetical protein CCHR01_09453 [Colletotrichum chrysophilum]|uniref:Uncharacterized protein n=1 Tax=Colletotrichum chrysophilum TaxID=1836956 RepID=A0AAD9AHT6_9PEZI|nr:hypothetical protein CCHR01_09453 [Colletotrichum chrysophilum]